MAAFAVVIAAALSVSFGARDVEISDIWVALSSSDTSDFSVVAVRERLPRTVLALVAGAALGIAGALMQAITRNPLADPGILGINTGAALFVVSGIAFFGIQTLNQYIWLALAGAALTALLVYAIGSSGRGGATPLKLALAGAATTAALSSLVSAVLLPRTEVMNVFRFWQVGSVSGAEWPALAQIAPLLAGAALLGFALCGPINALALGDDVAAGLGVNVAAVRALAAVAGVVLCGTVTAVAGPIAFVGLMVPHAVRPLTGPDMRWLLPTSALAGAVLLTVADVIGRILGRPGELEAGIVTVALGAPVLIMIARRAKVREL
ncbi:FecCD family ABC transporter permease [Microbacterium amylolyticum]|uniref:Iron complex transport system permease protein n=1 Tax=Microbacterium amylolyticum TaxID=936337 RepID=A0ABS4ZDT4_9MICO|nr:iron chelate uptake ABC transporter family permease subunit [Microbacterium amylolyticum]MBP2435456.1 iron complex transport system permease protein [Microbacterium amylolyticum]